MTTLEAVKVNKINYKEFIKQVKADKFKVEEVNYSKLIDKKIYAEVMYMDTKKKADKYKVKGVQSLFNELCAEQCEIIDIHTYMKEYMELVNKTIKNDNVVSRLPHEEQKVYRDIMELRGAGAYKSNLAEISVKLLCKEIYEEEYEVAADDKCDGILGVDVVLLSREEEVAHYIHVTKNTRYSMDRLKNKSGQEVTVIDDRLDNSFGWPDEQLKQHRRSFKNHVLCLYSDGECAENTTINGVYIFKEEYIRELVKDNYGLCTKKQYEELQHLEYSNKQIRKYGNRTVTYYE